MQENTHKEKSALDNLKPRAAFKVGLLSGLAVMFVIGFLILAGVLINGGDEKISKNDNGAVVNQPTNPGVAQPPANNNVVVQPVTKDDWGKGDKNAKISIVEYSDTECPFCKRFHATMQQVLADYEGDVNWVYRHFPLTSLHSKAIREAEATECAGEQKGNDGFWAYIDRMFEITPANNGLQDSQLPEIAQYVGLDVGKFQECLDSGKYKDKIQDQIAEAQKTGARGTPYSVIISGDQNIPIPGALPYEQVKAMLDPLIK